MRIIHRRCILSAIILIISVSVCIPHSSPLPHVPCLVDGSLHTYARTHACTHTHTCMHIVSLAAVCIRTHARTHMHAHCLAGCSLHTHARTHTHTHARTLSRWLQSTYARTHTHAHTLSRCWSLLSGVYARGSKISHTGGKCVTCRGLHILA